MSDTPKTDKEIIRTHDGDWVDAEFARKLERDLRRTFAALLDIGELYAAKTDGKWPAWYIKKHGDVVDMDK